VEVPPYFVTGGGWFWSEKGDFRNDLQLESKANFGLVAKYFPDNPVPQGSLEFNLRKGELKFHSTLFETLKINPDSGEIELTGWGKTKTEESYQFQLWGMDAEPDLFRIRIWKPGEKGNQVLYDNRMEQPLEGGNIKIHKE
jgi:hypothetical protein